MARYYGKVGYADTIEVAPGVWREVITERAYSGDILKNTRKLESSSHVNDDVNVNNLISILGDEYAFQNFFAIRYVTWMGVRWKVPNLEVLRPRIVLTLGGVYNGIET